MNELALSISALAEQDKTLMSKPVSTLARMAGLNVDEVYSKLLVGLTDKDLGEALRYAETALEYAKMVDRNRLREECGLSFITSLEMVIKLIREGLETKDGYLKRKAIKLHAQLIDEAAEKSRFVESVMLESKLQMIATSRKNIDKLEAEMLEFEENNDGSFEMR